jgi:hypothetical protein
VLSEVTIPAATPMMSPSSRAEKGHSQVVLRPGAMMICCPAATLFLRNLCSCSAA